ncbi:hypothetical protein LAZ67_19002573 [Cordylochernes scorpioides]|uniref:Reverse transcriptase zinc-binding domain-containing protein n=1 Tax=Cordylochernes scorpioides TaxID=51811 RepID=A0ABY6LIL8_9ARAC|nr:hypothetical protein LAZ67_19002573 [Cordylochernes scorpioides]
MPYSCIVGIVLLLYDPQDYVVNSLPPGGYFLISFMVKFPDDSLVAAEPVQVHLKPPRPVVWINSKISSRINVGWMVKLPGLLSKNKILTYHLDYFKHTDITCFIVTGNQLLSQNFNISEAWTNSWISSDIPNKNLITSPNVKIPDFSLPRREWVLLNRFRTGQGRCAELMKLWGYTKDPNCACNVPQSMSHILDDCPLYKFNGGISNLHSVTPEALNWLKALPLRL